MLPQEVLSVRFDDPEGEQQVPEVLPMIVIVVDEFADLMMQQGKDVEVCVARLAQKARAAGMHVNLATQRPSADVITGIIKANFPTRIAYRVAQKVDSRTILDEQGAEHLLGRGDRLIKLNGTNETRRVQCLWVSEAFSFTTSHPGRGLHHRGGAGRTRPHRCECRKLRGPRHGRQAEGRWRIVGVRFLGRRGW